MTKGCGTPVEGDKICKVNLRGSASASAASGLGDVEAIADVSVEETLIPQSMANRFVIDSDEVNRRQHHVIIGLQRKDKKAC